MLDVLVLASTLAAVAPCATPRPAIASGVAALHGEVVEAESFTPDELREIAGRSGAPPAHPPFGFYAARLAHDVRIRTEERRGPEGARCGTLTTATARLALVDRVVGLARDLRERGCDRDAVARHYRKHALADDRVLSRHVQALNAALTAAWPRLHDALPASGPPDEAALRRVVEPIVAEAAAGIERDREAALAGVDTPAEMLALAAACTARS